MQCLHEIWKDQTWQDHENILHCGECCETAAEPSIPLV